MKKLLLLFFSFSLVGCGGAGGLIRDHENDLLIHHTNPPVEITPSTTIIAKGIVRPKEYYQAPVTEEAYHSMHPPVYAEVEYVPIEIINNEPAAKKRNVGSMGGVVLSYEEIRYPSGDYSYWGNQVLQDHFGAKRMLKIIVKTYDGEIVTITQPQINVGQWFYVGQRVRIDEIEGKMVLQKTN